MQTDETEKHHLLNNGRRILNVFDEKISLKNKYEVYITGTIGISVYPDHGTDIEELIKNADAAISTARKFGKNAYKIYDRAMNQEIIRNMKIEASLQKAMQNDEIELYFQPKLDLKVNKINSMEALLRWHHPELGFIPPNVFIPIAEETGAIWQLDEWVLRKACEQNRIWNMSDHYNYKIAVNISASYFGQPEFVAMVKNVLLETKLDPCLLELEITETTIINSPDECLQNVKILRGMGVTVSVDDFGTGYTSLNYLRKIPFDTLKIDQSYVRQMLIHKEDMAIIRTIITLAHDLELKVVAEGSKIKKSLIHWEIGCDEIQGYYISRPLQRVNLKNNL